MRITITGKKTVVTPALREFARKKIGKLERYFDGVINARVVLSVEGRRQVVEIELSVVKGGMVVSMAESDDMYRSLDMVMDKLPRQLKKYKAKLHQKNKRETTRLRDDPTE